MKIYKMNSQAIISCQNMWLLTKLSEYVFLINRFFIYQKSMQNLILEISISDFCESIWMKMYYNMFDWVQLFEI